MMKQHLRCALVCAMLVTIALANFAQSGDNRARQNDSVKVESDKMELIIFARFHAREGKEAAVEAELRDAVARVRKERGCLGREGYGSARDWRPLFRHSRWASAPPVA